MKRGLSVNTVFNNKVVSLNVRYNEHGERYKLTELNKKVAGFERVFKNKTPTADDLSILQALTTVSAEVMADDLPDNVADKIVHDIQVDSPNQAVSKKVQLNQFLDPLAPIKEISGLNDSVPLMEQAFDGAIIDMKLWAVGFKNSLYNELANTLFNVNRVARAGARWYVNVKNRELFAPLLAVNSWTGYTQSAATTGTYREKLYETAERALDAVFALNYRASNELVGNKTGRNIIIASPSIARKFVFTDIDTNTKTIAEALGVEVFAWGGVDGGTYGAETWDALRLPQDAFFVVHLPNSQESLPRITGADLEYRTGKGSVLNGGSDEMLWARYAGVYTDNFLPYTSGSKKHGCVIKASLPL